MNFLGMIDNLKTKHVNVLTMQLPCQKLFSSYLGYKKLSFTDRSKAVLLLWIFYVFVMSL